MLAAHSMIEVPQLAADQLGLGLTGRTCFPGRWVFAGHEVLASFDTGIVHDLIVE